MAAHRTGISGLHMIGSFGADLDTSGEIWFSLDLSRKRIYQS
jgi:hypothetical protein